MILRWTVPIPEGCCVIWRYPCLTQCEKNIVIQGIFIEHLQWVNHHANIMEKKVTHFKGAYIQMRYAMGTKFTA